MAHLKIKKISTACWHFYWFCDISRMNTLQTETLLEIVARIELGHSIYISILTPRHFIFIISYEQHCSRQSHHTNIDTVGSQSGTAMLSYKCLILIHTLYSLYCIQHLSKQNTFPDDRPFFGTLTSLARQKWNFSMGRAQLQHYLKVTITQGW